MATIAANIQQVRARIAAACAAAQRPVQSVTLLAVSKTFGPDAVRDASRAGERCFGENYVQEALDKMAALAICGATSSGTSSVRCKPTRHVPWQSASTGCTRSTG
jgi:uncharacterized pyridoxal phosphate-containing UPF0001 family protein